MLPPDCGHGSLSTSAALASSTRIIAEPARHDNSRRRVSRHGHRDLLTEAKRRVEAERQRCADAAAELRGSASDEEPLGCLEPRLDDRELLAQPGRELRAPALKLECELDTECVKRLAHPEELALGADRCVPVVHGIGQARVRCAGRVRIELVCARDPDTG
jgi:hypothetical protein